MKATNSRDTGKTDETGPSGHRSEKPKQTPETRLSGREIVSAGGAVGETGGDLQQVWRH